MSGETSDISQFCELEWYEWIIFRDSAVSFPEDKMVLGRYLVLSIDIGPAVTVNIIKSNGEVVHWSTCQALLSEELESTEQQTVREAFKSSVAIKFVSGATVEGFDQLGAVDTPEYYLYK